MLLTNLLTAVRARSSLNDLTASLTCSALSPEGPGAVPGWKEFTAFKTRSGETLRGGVSGAGLTGRGIGAARMFVLHCLVCYPGVFSYTC